MITPVHFEQLFRQSYRPLFRLAYTLLEDEDDCQDVIHEVMANYWEKQPEIKTGKEEGYLKQAVYNACLNLLASKERNQKLKIVYPEMLRQRSTVTENQELWEKIQWYIREKMPPKTRKVITLCFLQGFSYQEVAEMLKISPSTVNMHVVNGLRMLRNEFNPTGKKK